MKTLPFLPVLFAAILGGASHDVLARDILQPLSLIGNPAPAQAAADQVVMLGESTSCVNVTAGSTVRFVVEGHAFSWRFDSAMGRVIPFDLERIAPKGWLRRPVRVYVAANPLYHD